MSKKFSTGYEVTDMYDRTYIIVKRLFVELHRVKYNHVDEDEIYKRTNEILERLKELETILKHKIEE
tara:strand:- start:598 stop:798 length:201 start_codon:yes stop_codon:yes gene_type:complete